MFVDKMLVPKIQVNVRVVVKLARIDVRNKQSQKKEDMFISREDFRNILSYCDYSRLCYVITKFLEIIPELLENGIKFSLSKIKISI